jgi:hypothetical protein
MRYTEIWLYASTNHHNNMNHDTRNPNKPASLGLHRHYTRSLHRHHRSNPKIQPEITKAEEIIFALIALACVGLGVLMALGEF